MFHSGAKDCTPGKQIVSKQRIADHGEVFTAEREVNAMLDLVKQETERIDSRFLEPACGKGAFLTEILRRKLAIVRLRYQRNKPEYEKYLVLAVASIYGIDLLPDNVADCRTALRTICIKEHTALYPFEPTESVLIDTIDFILSRNIALGDALTLKYADGSDRPIVFSEWSLVRGNLFKRRDFYFSALVDSEFNGVFDSSDTGETRWSPVPVREFPITDYKRLKDADEQ